MKEPLPLGVREAMPYAGAAKGRFVVSTDFFTSSTKSFHRAQTFMRRWGPPSSASNRPGHILRHAP